MRRLVLVPALVAAALLAPSVHAAPPTPQVVDVAGDANGGANATSDTADKSVEPVNQAYADVVSVLWQATKTTKKVKGKTVTTVTGFTVTTTLSAAPTPPAPTQLVYRMLGSTPACGFFGVVYYTAKSSDPTIPQSAIRDNCGVDETRLTAIALPKIQGNTITWTVPLSAIPSATKVKAGSKILDLWFEVRELQDLGGPCLPDDGGVTGFGNACGFANGILDNSKKNGAPFTLG